MALIIAPVFLLVSGGSLEALGVINLIGDDEEDDEDYDDYYVGIGVAPIGKQSIMTNTLTWTMVRASIRIWLPLMTQLQTMTPWLQ